MRNSRVLFMMLACCIVLVPAALVAGDQPAKNDVAAPAATATAGNDANEDKGKEESPAEHRAKLDDIARTTLEKLFAASPDSKKLYDRAYGYAVFDNSKVSLGLSGAGGSGVAIPRAGGKHIYMKMGSGGVGVGAGYQEYQLVFLFEDEKSFTDFVNENWTADASATAVGGKSGASVAGDFANGIALFKLNEKGLAADADVSGTKYWRDKKLNS